MDADETEETFDLVLPKIFRALHFKHTGKIAPIGEQIVTYRWFTNAYVHMLESEEFAPFLSLPSIPPIRRNGRNLADQFGYRYAVDDTRDVSAFLVRFRLSMIAVGIVVQSADLLRKEDESQRKGEISAEMVLR